MSEELKELLEDLLEYMENKSDIRDAPGQVPNKEMQFVTAIEEQLNNQK